MLLDNITKNPRVGFLSKCCKSTSGFGGLSGLSSKISKMKQNCKQIPVIKGDCIGRYEHRKQYWFEFIRVNLTGRTTDTLKLGSPLKILLRKTGDSLIATLDESGIYPEQSLYFLYNFNHNIKPKYILGLLNSKLLTRYYQEKLITNKSSIAQLKKIHLDILPIRLINFAINSDKIRHDKIITLVDRMLVLYKQKQATKNDSVRDRINREILVIDEQIDTLVYQLYGLTKEEIKIIEKG